MKHLCFLVFLMLFGSAAFPQWAVSGNVSDMNSQPVVGKTVYVSVDSIPNYPGFFGQATTDANGDYMVFFAADSPYIGAPVNVSLYDCNNVMVVDTPTYVGYDITQNFVICAAVPPPPTSIEGTITAANPVTGEPDAQVYLIELAIDSFTLDTTLTAIDSTITDSVGHYTFAIPNVANSYLKVKAALLPANANYTSYLPTYYTSSIVWGGATSLPNPLPNTGINIQLTAGVNPGGPAFIGGNVAQGANKSTAVGDPLNHRILILTNMNNQAVAYTYSNASGHFSFSNLPLGTYKLFGDVMAKSNPPLSVTLDAAHLSVNNIEFQEHSHLFDGHFITIATSVSKLPAALQNAAIFPNPATDKITVTGIDNVTGTRNVTLTAMNGSIVYAHNFTETETITVPLASLSRGIYVLQVNTAEGNVIFKVSK